MGLTFTKADHCDLLLPGGLMHVLMRFARMYHYENMPIQIY